MRESGSQHMAGIRIDAGQPGHLQADLPIPGCWIRRTVYLGIAPRSASAHLLRERNSASDNFAPGCIQTYVIGGMMWDCVAAVIASKKPLLSESV